MVNVYVLPFRNLGPVKSYAPPTKDVWLLWINIENLQSRLDDSGKPHSSITIHMFYLSNSIRREKNQGGKIVFCCYNLTAKPSIMSLL